MVGYLPLYFGLDLHVHLKFRLQDETARVEDELLKSESIDALLKCFVSAKNNSFENLLDPFLKITRLSTPITIAVAKSPAFFKRIIDRLGHNSKAVVRLNLLRILRGVCEVHPNRAMLVERYGLLGVVERLSRGGGDGAVLVRELAREIVPALKPALKPAAARSKTHGSVDLSSFSSQKNLIIAPKKVRRAASEANASPFGNGSLVGLSDVPLPPRLGSAISNGGGKMKTPSSASSSRQRLGDIPWQNTNSSGGSRW
jgi:hypothetical protein